MEIAMINEHEFQQDLEATALPALAQGLEIARRLS